MTPREWLTEGEIRRIVLEENKDVHEQIRDAFFLQNNMLEKQNVLLDKIADGAQAQILSATILHGSTSLGLKGAIPDLIERVTQLEKSDLEDRYLADTRHGQNTVRLDKLEVGQHRIIRFVGRMFRWSATNGDGEVDYKKIAGIGSAIALFFHFFLAYFSWTNLKMAIAKLAHLFR